MNLPTEVFGSVVVVHTPEELSADHSDGVESFLNTLDHNDIVLDLDNTELIDGAGLSMLLDAQEHLRELGGDLKVSTTNHINRKILEITRLDEQLEVFDNVVDAVKSYS